MIKLANLIIVIGSFIVCFVLLFSGCGSSQENNRKTAVASNQLTDQQDISQYFSRKNYTIYFADDNYYLRFDEENLDVSSSQLAAISFKSIDALVDAIQTGNFSEAEYSIIQTAFPKSEKGIVLFDIYHICDAVMPAEFKVECVGWYGPTYTFALIDSSNCFAIITPMSRDSYRAQFAYEYETFFDREQIKVKNRESVADRNAEIVWYETDVATLKQIRYTLPNGVIVEERYRLSSDIAQVSDTIPLMIHLYGEANDFCFCAVLSGLKERPTVEWLSQFGVKSRSDD